MEQTRPRQGLLVWKIPDNWLFLGELIPVILAAATPLTYDVAGVIAEYIAEDDTEHSIIVHNLWYRYGHGGEGEEPDMDCEVMMTKQSWKNGMGFNGFEEWKKICEDGFRKRCTDEINGGYPQDFLPACQHKVFELYFIVPKFPRL
jgi:hypothetical protein